MGFLINKSTKTIHNENCTYVNEHYKKTKGKKNCKYLLFKTQKSAEQFFINQDKKYKFCKFCYN